MGSLLLHAEQDCIVLEQVPRIGFSGQDVPPEDVFNQCVRCGLCLPTCPTYVETLVETSGPRGRIALMRAVAEGQLDLTSPGFMHQMHECLDCRACEAVCPSGVRYGELLEPARTQIVRATSADRALPARLGRAVLIGALFSHLWLHAGRGDARAASISAADCKRWSRSSGLLRALRLDGIEALAPRMSKPRFFVAAGQRFAAQGPRNPQGDGVLSRRLYHARCVCRLERSFGARLDARRRRGSGAARSGLLRRDHDPCRRDGPRPRAGQAQHRRLRAQRRGRVCDQCRRVRLGPERIRRAFPRRYGMARARRGVQHRRCAISTSISTRSASTPGLGQPSTAVATYQDPCHLAHAQRITAPPRRLLAQIPGLEIRELEESSLCCGSAGIYNVTQPEMAAPARTAARPNTSVTSRRIFS